MSVSQALCAFCFFVILLRSQEARTPSRSFLKFFYTHRINCMEEWQTNVSGRQAVKCALPITVGADIFDMLPAHSFL